MITGLNKSEISTINAMWALINQADTNVQRELYIRLRSRHKGNKEKEAGQRTGLDYVKSLAVGKGKVPVWEDGKGVVVDEKYGL